MASIISNRFFYNLLVGYESDALKAAILSDSYIPDKDHDVFSDVSANEIASAGYTAGGAVLTNVAATQDDAGDKAKLDCDDLAWSGVTLSDARYLVIYNTSNSNNILCIYDFGSNQVVTNGDFQVSINALGLLSIAQA